MKAITRIVFSILFLISIFSCSKDDTKKGTATFGANYNVINCITTVTVFIDGEKLGKLTFYTDTILYCGQPENLNKQLSVGPHDYKVEIRPITGIGCTKDIIGTISIIENECTKIFIDYRKIDL